MAIELVLRDTETGEEKRVDVAERWLIPFDEYEGYVVRHALQVALDEMLPDRVMGIPDDAIIVGRR